jgi:predicted ribosomally synthesized peptide with nif11-like leader
VSQENAREFIRKVGAEKSFSNMLDNLKSGDDLLNAAKSLGYGFTIEELRLAIVRIMDLEDADLENINGGAGMSGYEKMLSLAGLADTKSAGRLSP